MFTELSVEMEEGEAILKIEDAASEENKLLFHCNVERILPLALGESITIRAHDPTKGRTRAFVLSFSEQMIEVE